MIKKIQTKLYFLSLSIFIVLIDQITKYLMSYNNKLFINKDFLLFKLDFVKNYGWNLPCDRQLKVITRFIDKR